MKYMYYDKLLQRRREILTNIHALNELSSTANYPESEVEMKAQYETSYQNLEKLEERYRDEMHLIDKALNKIENNTFGYCEECGKPISRKRLEAVPWTTTCLDCAHSHEYLDFEEKKWGHEEYDFHLAEKINPSEYTDEELQELLHEKLEQDARIETLDIHIACESGLIYITGTVPEESQYQILFQTLGDIVDLSLVVDAIQIRPNISPDAFACDIEQTDMIDDEMLWPEED